MGKREIIESTEYQEINLENKILKGGESTSR